VANADTDNVKTDGSCLAPIKLKVGRGPTNEIPTGTNPQKWRQNKDEAATDAYNPDFDTARKFGCRAFLIHCNHVVTGFIRKSECHSQKWEVPECVVDLVGSFYEDEDAGMFQLAHSIRKKMGRARIRSVSKRLIKKLTVRIMAENAVEGALSNIKDGDYYLNELLKRDYFNSFNTDMEPTTSESKINFMFTMEKGLIFDCFEFRE